MADLLLSAERSEQESNIKLVSLVDGPLYFATTASKIIALGDSVYQGITNFNIHQATDKHKGNQPSGKEMAAKTAEIVLAQLDKEVFMVKNLHQFCRPCKYEFSHCK